MRLHRSLIAFLLILAIGHSTDVRADLFWDSNGSSSGGSNSDTAPGTWGVDNFWSADLNGLAGTGPWTADETAVFAADANVSGTYSVTVSGTQSASGIRFEEGTVTLTGGTVDLTNAATVTVGTGLTSTINSVIGGAVGLNQGGDGTLVLGGANTYAGNTRLLTNPTVGTFNILRLGASGVIPDTSVLEIQGANSIIELNGNSETVKSIATINTGAGALANSRLDIGSATLTLSDLVGEVSSFGAQIITSGTGKIIKNGAGQFNISGSNANWTGEFVLNDGLLNIGANNTLGTTTSGTAKITLNGGTIVNATSSKSIQTQQIDITNSFSALLGTANFQFLGTGNVVTPEAPAGDEGSAVITLKVNSNTTITVNNTGTDVGTFIFTGPVGDEGQNRSITKDGAGSLTFNSSTNSWGGDTTILAGQIRIDQNAVLGDGTGTINFAGGNLATTNHRDPVTRPIVNAINMTADAIISTTRQLGDVIEANFTTSSITATAGTLTFRNDATGITNPDNQFEPRFSGSGFNFSRPIVIAAGLNDPVLRTTRFSSANASGTQTYSGVISGPGKFRRMVSGGTTVLTAANTYSGGTDVEGGTLSVSGALATLGAGDVTVTGGTLSIATGVANALADTAALSISGTGMVSLGSGISDIIAGLSLGGAVQTTAGTYGSSSSGAMFQNNTFFAGMGVVNLVLPSVDDADFDGDGDVDGSDLLTWQRGLGLSGGAATVAAGNANGDTVIDGADLAVWRSQYGSAVPAVGAVPEPAAAWMALAAMAGLLGRRTWACRRPCK